MTSVTNRCRAGGISSAGALRGRFPGGRAFVEDSVSREAAGRPASTSLVGGVVAMIPVVARTGIQGEI